MAKEFWQAADGVSVEAFDIFIKKFRTIRVTHTVTSDEVSLGSGIMDIPFNTPFVDTNYTVDGNTALVSASGDLDTAIESYFIAGIQKFKDHVRVGYGVLDAGDVIELHIIAIHD